MDQKINTADSKAEAKIQALCRTLEEGGVKVSDHFIAFSKNPGKHA